MFSWLERFSKTNAVPGGACFSTMPDTAFLVPKDFK